MKLIDLSKDIREEHDVSEQFPEVAQRLLQQAEKICRELGDPGHKGDKVRPALYVNNPRPLILHN
jgi:hypothetical protein